MQPAPFTPDALYCVYCHAPAAGQCAECHAICCADCVELVHALVTPRAVCRSCLRDEGRAPSSSRRTRALRWAAPLVLLALLAYWLWAAR